jgi:hypothetical protein
VRSAGQNVPVHRKEREQILGEWGIREPSAREQREGAQLDQELEGSPLKGKRLRGRMRNFRPAVDRYVASLGGPLAYMQRLRQIELETEQHEQKLAQAWQELAETCDGDGAAFAGGWRRVAERWNFTAVNELIDRHNRWYPAEARLPMDPRSGDFVLVAGRPYRRRPLDAAWVLERFPAELGLALAA